MAQLGSLPTKDSISSVIFSSPLLSFHRSLCQVESITNSEHAVGNYLFSYLKKHNFHVLRQEVPQPSDSDATKRRFNVFAWPKNTNPISISASEYEDDVEGEDDVLGDFSPKVILTSHIDTVPPFLPYSVAGPSASSAAPQEQKLNRSEILISGRGTVDAKACVAAQIHAVLSLLSSHQPENDNSPPPPWTALPALPVALLFVVGEEHRGDGMTHFSSSPLHTHLSRLPTPYTTVIFGEPTEGRLASGHKGLLVFTLRAEGKAAHSGYPWLGRSANTMLIPVLAALDRLGELPEPAGGLPASTKYGHSTVNIGLVNGGVAANVVAEHAQAEVAIRLAAATPDAAMRVIDDAIRAVDPRVQLRHSARGYAPVDLDADVDGFDRQSVNYGTDVPNLDVGPRRVKRYLYGPGSIFVAHGDHEGLTVGDLEAAVQGYTRLILAGLGMEEM